MFVVFQRGVAQVVVLVAFVGYLAVAVYGAIMLQPGMKYVDLVLRSSYYYKFSSWDEDYFGQRIAIAFVVDQEIDYEGAGEAESGLWLCVVCGGRADCPAYFRLLCVCVP